MSSPAREGSTLISTGEELFRVDDLHKRFRMGEKEIHVLKGIRLTIRKGETLAILGASGVGKTTLLHILGALDRPTSGRVLYRGENLFEKTERGLASFRSREVGFVFQFHYLLSEFSALENVLLPGLIAGWSRARAEQRARFLLGELGLANRLGHRPGRLSGGEQQRVAVARALVMEPQVIFADEPTGNLDTGTAASVEDLLLGLRQSHGISVVVVTHNPRFARRLDRQVHMVDGRVAEGAGSDSLLSNEE
ncbi:MAG: ABC transporter ATP-binding protein [bacterium]